MRKWTPEWCRQSNFKDLLEMNSEATATLDSLSQTDVDLARLIWKGRIEMIRQEMELRTRADSKTP